MGGVLSRKDASNYLDMMCQVRARVRGRGRGRGRG